MRYEDKLREIVEGHYRPSGGAPVSTLEAREAEYQAIKARLLLELRLDGYAREGVVGGKLTSTR